MGRLTSAFIQIIRKKKRKTNATATAKPTSLLRRDRKKVGLRDRRFSFALKYKDPSREIFFKGGHENIFSRGCFVCLVPCRPEDESTLGNAAIFCVNVRE